MRSLIFVLLLGLMSISAGAHTDFQKVKAEAAKEHKLILVTFTGSDWCGPCRKLEKDIFSRDTFKSFAADNLVMVNADFPKKKELDAETVKQNRQLAAKYQRQRIFPFTVLLNAEGQVLAEWRGYPGISPEVFISQVSEFIEPDMRKKVITNALKAEGVAPLMKEESDTVDSSQANDSSRDISDDE